MDYSKTLNLPQMSLPFEVDPPKIELEILSIWNDLDIYEERQRLNRGKPKFVAHSSPISVHSPVCVDDALSIILKDIIVKHRLMCGFNVPRCPSWNCYSPAIEREALLSSRGKSATIRPSEVRKRSRGLYLECIELQKEQFQRLGVFANWDKPLLSLDPNYEFQMIEAFGNLYEAGYLYKGGKPTRWCIDCQTDLAEAETELIDYKLTSIYVKFPVIHGLEDLGVDVYMVVWTNTPWTLSANAAVTVNPEHDYVAVETENNGTLIMAANAVEDILGDKSEGEYETVRKMRGSDLAGVLCAHPFLNRDSKVLLDGRVPLASGTGCSHAAAMHSEGKHITGRRRYQELICAVDQNGQLTEEAGRFCGFNVFESSDLIALELEKRGCLLSSESVEQPYPHCPFCKSPTIVRVADRWIFNLSANNLQPRISRTLAEVSWLPDWGRRRALGAIAERSDWSISRQRMWGIPAPVFYCNKCNYQVDTLESINASKEMINKKGVGGWVSAKPGDILSEGVVCSRCGGREFQWEKETLDPEFISVMSYKTISPGGEDVLHSADICLGSNGQNEKWFQFSSLASMAIEGSLPFKSVLIHGPAVDESGKLISQSGDAFPSVQELLDEFGADTLRLWATSMDCAKRLKISHSRLLEVSKAHRRIRNTCRFLLSNLSGYDPKGDRVEPAHLQEFDRWALHRLAKLVGKITEALENYQFHLFYQLLCNFCSVDMSSLYLDIVRRRLYTFPQWSSSRRGAQTVIYEVVTTLVRLMAPVLSFTAEEIWRHIPGAKEECPSVHLSQWSVVNGDFPDDELESRWKQLLEIRSEIHRLIEKVRNEEGIGISAQASVTLHASSPDAHGLLDRYIDDLEAIFAVSKVRLMSPDAPVPDGIWKSDVANGLAVEIRRAAGEKCERCWKYSDTVGTNEQYPSLCHRCIAILEGGTYYI